jgi:beta-glucanase (GH16 family)
VIRQHSVSRAARGLVVSVVVSFAPCASASSSADAGMEGIDVDAGSPAPFLVSEAGRVKRGNGHYRPRTTSGTTEPAAIAGKGYRLVKNWDFETGIRGLEAMRLEFYTRYIYSNGQLDHLNDEWSRYRDNDNHVFEADGLALVARVPDGVSLAPGNVESGMLRSKWSGQYGYFEARMKVPAGVGTWPAFWLNPQDMTWPPEIDVVEIVNNAAGNTTTKNSFHFVHGLGEEQPTNFSLISDTWGRYYPGFDYAADYHTFAVEWTPEYVRHYVDDVLVVDRPFHWLHGDRTSGGAAHVLLNLGIGGNWPGAPTADSLPAKLMVKYVRVWQK